MFSYEYNIRAENTRFEVVSGAISTVDIDVQSLKLLLLYQGTKV